MPETPPQDTEGARRLHALVRVLLSAGVWMVLGAQITLVFLFQWRAPSEASSTVTALTTLLIAMVLMLFFFSRPARSMRSRTHVTRCPSAR